MQIRKARSGGGRCVQIRKGRPNPIGLGTPVLHVVEAPRALGERLEGGLATFKTRFFQNFLLAEGIKTLRGKRGATRPHRGGVARTHTHTHTHTHTVHSPGGLRFTHGRPLAE